MTTLRQIELRCPVCDNEFKSQSVVSTNAFGGKRTDFHERAAGTQPLAYLIHMCSECGYSGARSRFQRRRRRESGSQAARVPRAGAAPSVVRLPARRSTKPRPRSRSGREWITRHVADLLLRAAWCCVDEGDIEAERYFRRLACRAFEEALRVLRRRTARGESDSHISGRRTVAEGRRPQDVDALVRVGRRAKSPIRRASSGSSMPPISSG